jgi:Domain of unknown function (DUF4126)
MSRAVERLGGIVIPPGAYRPHHSAISAFTDIGQGAGLATTGGLRPLLPLITVGVMAHEDAGVNFSGTDWSWMESWVFIGILAAVFVAFWVVDRLGTSNPVRPAGRPPEAGLPYVVLCAAAGALLFAGSLADGGETSWPGLVAGAIVGFIGYLALARFFVRANRRLAAAGDPGVVLGLGRDALTIVLTVVIVLLDPLGYVVLLAALALLVTARRREGEKYEGLRILR